MQQFAEEPYRFVNVTIFLFSCLANSFISQSLSTISLQIERYYSVPLIEVNMCALVFMIVHPLMAFVANYVLNKHGLKVGCTINACCVIVGVIIRTFVDYDFIFVLVGNTFIALGNVFIMNAASQFSVTWFRPDLRLIVTSLAVFTTLVSGGIGALISPFVVKESFTDEEGRKAVFKLMVYQAGFVGGIMLLNLILFRGRPRISPTAANTIQRTSFWKGVKKLAFNRSYVMIFFVMMLFFGTVNAFIVTLAGFLAPFGYGSERAGIGLSITVCTGLIGSILSSFLIKNTKKYKLILSIEIAATIGASLLLIVPLEFHVVPLFWVAIGLMGLFIYPVIPGNIELACQTVFPVGEALATGFLLAGGQLFGFLLGVGQSYILKGRSMTSSVIGGSIYVFFFVVSLVIFLNTKIDLKREDYEKNYHEQLMTVGKELF